MGEFNPFEMDEFSWDVLKAYVKHGHGMFKLYNTTFFSCHLTDETVCMTLREFYDKASTYSGDSWKDISPLEDYNEN